jgi:hypothetical protein
MALYKLASPDGADAEALTKVVVDQFSKDQMLADSFIQSNSSHWKSAANWLGSQKRSSNGICCSCSVVKPGWAAWVQNSST